MKKIIAFGVIALAVVSLTGCGGARNPGNTNPEVSNDEGIITCSLLFNHCDSEDEVITDPRLGWVKVFEDPYDMDFIYQRCEGNDMYVIMPSHAESSPGSIAIRADHEACMR